MPSSMVTILLRSAAFAWMDINLPLIGFDDIFFAEYSHTGLTTVRQHKFEMGYEGAKLLDKIMEQPDYVPKKKRIVVELIIRESA